MARLWLLPIVLVGSVWISQTSFWPLVLIAVVLAIWMGLVISSSLSGAKQQKLFPSRFLSFALGFGAAKIFSRNRRSSGGGQGGGGGN